MPLQDHFHPPWSVQRPWEGFHGDWATAIAFHLNSGVLPAEYFAMPLLQVSGQVEGTAVWAPPQPILTVPLEATDTDAFEVQVLRNFGGPQLRAAIELVSPADKDRKSSRHAFAAKCAGYLRRGVSVIVVDVVTERNANLHGEILHELERPEEPVWKSPTYLYTVSYRSVLIADQPRLEAWPHALKVGDPLPELPMWLEPDLCVPLRLEESYSITCGSLRMKPNGTSNGPAKSA